MKIMKTFMMKSVILAMAMAVVLTACSSDDDDNNGTQEEDPAELSKVQEQMQAELMLSALCKYDSTTAAYTPRIGEAINAPTPTIYYTIANTVDQARSHYESIVAALRTDVLDTSALPTDVTRGDVHLTFAPSTADGETARITVDCPKLKDVLTTIVFVPEAAWPENDVVSPFNFLSCWREKSTGYYYVCIREAKGGDGIMITFDGGWEEDWFTEDTYYQGKFYLWKNVASTSDFLSLYECIDNSPNKFHQMNLALQNAGEATSSTRNFINQMDNKTEDITFDLTHTHKSHWYDWHWYYRVWKLYLWCYQNKYAFGMDSWTMHYQVPSRRTPSHSFTFNRYSKRDDSKWEAIYR